VLLVDFKAVPEVKEFEQRFDVGFGELICMGVAMWSYADREVYLVEQDLEDLVPTIKESLSSGVNLLTKSLHLVTEADNPPPGEVY